VDIRLEKHSWGYFVTNGKKAVAIVSKSPEVLKRVLKKSFGGR